MDGTIIKNYLDKSTWDIKENANQIFCSGHMTGYLAGKLTKDYWLNSVFTPEIKEAHETGLIHIHDLSTRMTPYCMSFSTSQVILKGLIGPNGRISSAPPKHMDSAINLLVNFIGIISQEAAGAVALNDFSLYLAPFVYYDKLDYKRVKQCIQSAVFHWNQPNRWGESSFSNVTLSLSVPDDLKNTKVIIGGEVKDKTYSEFETEMNMINQALLDVLIEGDANGKPMTFPVLTIGIDENFPWDSEIAKKVFQVTAKYGTPFFENFSKGTGRNVSDSRSLCCHLSLDKNNVRKHTGGIFGNSDSMGSLSVVTINLNRIGYLANTKEEYYQLLDNVLNICKDTLDRRRAFLNEQFKNELYPYTKIYLDNYNNFFDTIGVIGGNESMLNFMGKTLMEDEAISFMEEVLHYINKKCEQFQEETGNLFNSEAVPGEGCSHSLALKDKKLYGDDIITAGIDVPYLTNSTLPAVEETDILDILTKQERLQLIYTGGTGINIYLGEKLDNYLQAKKLVKSIIQNTKIPYFSITPIYSICKTHNYLVGEHITCPICNEPTEVFSRVVGYLKPKTQFNNGKSEEFKNRNYFKYEDFNSLVK